MRTHHKVILGDCLEGMKLLGDESVDLVVTSPPYDDLRLYGGYHFDFEPIAEALLRVLREGGVIVWVIGDRISNGNRTLTSLRQAIHFQDIGLKAHDLMIFQKQNTPFMRSNAYTNCYDFMFVFSKGSPRTFNPIMEMTKGERYEMMPFGKRPDATYKKSRRKVGDEKVKSNIWDYPVGLYGTTSDKEAFLHPATFPETLARDHILSWTNEGDTVLDPMAGSFTVSKMAIKHDRNSISMEINPDYWENIGRKRLKANIPTLDNSVTFEVIEIVNEQLQHPPQTNPQVRPGD